MLLGFGLAIGFVAYLLPGTWAVAATLFIAWGWMTITLKMFEQHHLWLPLAVPMLVQVPVALFGGLLWQYLSANLERRNISRAIRYYLPEKAAADMTRRSADPGSARDLVHGTCVASDAARFTALAESMAPRDLAILLDSYFATLFEQIQFNGGTVTDVVGDGIMSVWAAQQPERDLRFQAVIAALDMTAAVRRFNRLRPDKPMPTRFGLHAGWIMVGNVGGQGHFAWSVVGDIPNTASRLEGLNKHLGTSVLASREVVGDLETVLTRRLGRFRLFGKADALEIHEVVARRSEASAAQLRLVALFEPALEACEAGRIAEASDLLHRVLTEFPDDGPSRFYLERCAGHNAGTRILDDTAIVRLEAK
jgi:adenylate cyclase